MVVSSLLVPGPGVTEVGGQYPSVRAQSEKCWGVGSRSIGWFVLKSTLLDELFTISRT